ncbi:hypothetical protein CDAR_285341 [Caerostris darwini]|uniref:Uncharacterized protein n=1 Tax=Caerostris darwini TaxID=1538125 RepID=A0AAV4SXI2_9ARAC|nr:hypothetical protein CDAR_285341 [Caerostris darwini]
MLTDINPIEWLKFTHINFIKHDKQNSPLGLDFLFKVIHLEITSTLSITPPPKFYTASMNGTRNEIPTCVKIRFTLKVNKQKNEKSTRHEVTWGHRSL